MLVLDAGAVTRLAERSKRAAELIRVLRQQSLWPPAVPSVVLVESLTGRPDRDTRTNRFLKTCEVMTDLSEPTARRAAALRHQAGRGSAVDAVVVATAEPGGAILTGDIGDLHALAQYCDDVTIKRA
jgi:predicted nucleic acid-binding protein